MTIDLKSRAFDHNITLFDTSGKNIAQKTGNSQNRRESQLTVKLPSNGTYNPHSADVGGIFLSVVKSGNPKVFPLNLCGFNVTGAAQISRN